MKTSSLRKLAFAFALIVGLSAALPASAARGSRPIPPVVVTPSVPISGL